MPLNEKTYMGKGNELVVDSDYPKLMKLASVGSEIWVHSDYGDDTGGNGTQLAPYKTLNTAWAALTAARNVIMLAPTTTEYTLTASLAAPLFDTFIVGAAGDPDLAVIGAAVSVTPLISIAPDTLTGTTSYHFVNIAVDNGETSQIGIQVDNADAGKKILIYIDGCWFSDGGTSIDVDHDGASDAVRIYMNSRGREIEGNIAFDVGNASDKFIASDALFSGTFVTAGDDIAALFRFANCIVPHGAWASNSGLTTQEIVCMGCMSVTGTTYAALDTNELGAGGDFAETIVG